MVVKKKATKPKKVTKKAKPSFDAEKEINDILVLIKQISEILQSHQKLIDKIKGRMGL